MRTFKLVRYFLVEGGQIRRSFDKDYAVLEDLFLSLDAKGLDSVFFNSGGIRAIVRQYEEEVSLPVDSFYSRYRTTTYLGADCYSIKFKLPKEDSEYLDVLECIHQASDALGRLEYYANQLTDDTSLCTIQYLFKNNSLVPVLAVSDTVEEGVPCFNPKKMEGLKEIPRIVLTSAFVDNYTQDPSSYIQDSMETNGYESDMELYDLLVTMLEDYSNSCETWTKSKMFEHQNKFATLYNIAKKTGLPVERLIQ